MSITNFNSRKISRTRFNDRNLPNIFSKLDTSRPVFIEYALVGGGAGGGQGGGGAGGVARGTLILTTGSNSTVSISIGGGGGVGNTPTASGQAGIHAGSNGSPSSITTPAGNVGLTSLSIIAAGGGSGGGAPGGGNQGMGWPGGSGGGHGRDASNSIFSANLYGLTPNILQGSPGGFQSTAGIFGGSPGAATNQLGGAAGGGGYSQAGSPGQAGGGDNTQEIGGYGGNGLIINWRWANEAFAGGGGGASQSENGAGVTTNTPGNPTRGGAFMGGVGGIGGGGWGGGPKGANVLYGASIAGTGGGGGGATSPGMSTAGSGGRCMIRYPVIYGNAYSTAGSPNIMLSPDGNLSNNQGYWVFTWTGPGSITFPGGPAGNQGISDNDVRAYLSGAFPPAGGI
jgi:hypothetical protein